MKKMLRVIVVLLTSLLVLPAFASDSPEAPDADAATSGDDAVESDDEQLAQDAEVPSEAAAEAVEETTVEATTVEEVTLDESEDAPPSLIAPFSVSFSMSDTFTIGALARDKDTVSNYNLLSFGLSGSYATPVDTLSASISLSVSKFTTNSGGSTFQREARFGDIGLGLSYGSIWSDPDNTGLNLSGSLGFIIPTSDLSRFTNLRTTGRLGFGLSRAWGDFSVRIGISLRKNFHRDTSVVADLDDFALDVFARDGGTENIGEAQIALDTGVLSEWGLGSSVGLSYGWFPGFSTSLSFAFNNDWTYDNGTITENDEFTSEFADPGRGHGQSMVGSISASYAFLEYFSVGADLTTAQPVKTADNQSVRFPFFDLETGNLQNTTFSLSLSASY